MYDLYLRSRHWRAVRRIYWELHKPKCFVCEIEGTPSTIHLHHRTYERLWCEQWDDLVPLCGDCHRRVHDLVDAGQTLETAHFVLVGTDIYASPQRIQIGTLLQSDIRSRPFDIASVGIFDEDRKYSSEELDRMATYFLWARRDQGEADIKLTKDQWRRLRTTEIYNELGKPDPALTVDRFGNQIDGMYWRTHPQGRKFTPADLRRTTTSGFYGGVQTTSKEIVPPPPMKERVETPCPVPECPNTTYGLQDLCQRHYQMRQRGRALDNEDKRAKLTPGQREEIESSSEPTSVLAAKFKVGAKRIQQLRKRAKEKF